ncbi:hypothetical protein [Comamonas sp. NoAH]|uniref:hypothetical protein n=1 Tax=Comamonas halotolerans TaxID=3041496 RepID=UPI0024E061BB|nr:hypothetical protein [Comamonas sp. NoAH]
MASNPTQQAYDNWQAAKTPWYRQSTPTSAGREKEAEDAYSQAVRNPRSGVAFGGNPGAPAKPAVAAPSMSAVDTAQQVTPTPATPASKPEPSFVNGASQVSPGIYRVGDSYAGTAEAASALNAVPALKPSAQNMEAAEGLAGRRSLVEAADLQLGQQAQQVRAPTATHSGNDWTAREMLRRQKMDASSLIHKSHWAPKGSGLAAQAAYQKAAAADIAAMTGGQTQADVATMQQNAGLIGESMRQDGANQREGQRSLMDAARLKGDLTTQGFAHRAAAQQEQLRNTLLDPNATSEQRALAQRSLSALAGKTAADRMQTVNLPDTTNEMGAVVRGGQALIRVLEDGTAQQVPVGSMSSEPPANHIDALRKDPKLAAFFDEQHGKGAAARYLGR